MNPTVVDTTSTTEVYDDISDPVDRLVEGDDRKTRLRVYRRGDDRYCAFNIEYGADASGETPIGVDTGERHVLAATVYREDESNRAAPLLNSQPSSTPAVCGEDVNGQ